MHNNICTVQIKRTPRGNWRSQEWINNIWKALLNIPDSFNSLARRRRRRGRNYMKKKEKCGKGNHKWGTNLKTFICIICWKKYPTLPFVNPMYIMGAKSFVGKQNWFQWNLILSLIVPNQPTDNTLWCAVLVPSYIQKGVSLTHAYVGKWNLQTISYPERNESDPWIHGETVKVCKKKKSPHVKSDAMLSNWLLLNKTLLHKVHFSLNFLLKLGWLLGYEFSLQICPSLWIEVPLVWVN